MAPKQVSYSAGASIITLTVINRCPNIDKLTLDQGHQQLNYKRCKSVSCCISSKDSLFTDRPVKETERGIFSLNGKEVFSKIFRDISSREIGIAVKRAEERDVPVKSRAERNCKERVHKPAVSVLSGKLSVVIINCKGRGSGSETLNSRYPFRVCTVR